LLEKKLISTKGIICDSKSGTSGAGRKPQQITVFGEVNETLRAYHVKRHRHTPEIEQELSKIAGEEMMIRFTPHLIPIDRGLLSTIYVRPLKKQTTEDLLKVYHKFYKGEPFIRILPEGQTPSTKDVRGSNFCDISVHVDERTELITIISAIDNLNKGASGQAIQNMNLMNDLDETLGLTGTALIP
jgi:N-acetyl-gamma-glutamyl-phosphate reductase